MLSMANDLELNLFSMEKKDNIILPLFTNQIRIHKYTNSIYGKKLIILKRHND